MDAPSHLLVMALFAACVGIAGGVLTEDTPPQQARSAAKIFGGLLVSGIALGWLLYLFPL